MEHGAAGNGKLWNWLCHVRFAVGEWLESKWLTRWCEVAVGPIMVASVEPSLVRADGRQSERGLFITPVERFILA